MREILLTFSATFETTKNQIITPKHVNINVLGSLSLIRAFVFRDQKNISNSPTAKNIITNNAKFISPF